MKAAVIMYAGLCLAVLASGCGGSNEEQLWGIYQEPVAPREWPQTAGATELAVLWNRDLGQGADLGYALLKPAYGSDGLYAASRDAVFKLDSDTGEVQWRRELGAAIFSGVGVGESTLAVGLDNGKIVALQAATGDTRWEASLKRQISAIPAVSEARVIARATGGLIFALNAADGAAVWSLEKAAPGLSLHGDAPPVIAGDAVFIGLANGKLLVSDVLSGRNYWETELAFAQGRNELERLVDADAAPLVTASTVYTAAYRGHVAAWALENAAVKWQVEVSTRLPMSIGDGKLLVTSELGDIVAIDSESGAIAWTQPAFQGRGMSPPLVIGNRVIVGDASGNVHSLDLATGAPLERRVAVDGAVVGVVAGAGGQFAVFSSAGEISALTFPVVK